MPALRNILTTEVISTDVVITVGTITAVAIPLLVLAIIWLLLTRKRRLKAREKEHTVVELRQQIAGLEEHNRNLLQTQRANLDTLNQQTREINELRTRLREQTIFKAIYYDPDYGTSWIGNPEPVAKFFTERGFEVLNAQQLGHWVDERREYNESCRSLLVFAQDRMPDTIADIRSATCKLRLFLNDGARVVWHGDAPLWYKALPRERGEERYEEWMADGALRVLGVRTMLMEDIFPDRYVSGILTHKGCTWGMMLPGPAHRPVLAQHVDDVFSVGPPIKPDPRAPQIDLACAWRKVYNPNFPHSGFLRYWPAGRDGAEDAINADFFRFATSGWCAVPDVELPAVPRTEVFASGSEADEFRPANAQDGWEPAVVEGKYWSWIQIPGAEWIWWRHWVTSDFQTGGAVEHRRRFDLIEQPQRATLMLTVDDMTRDLRVNRTRLGDQGDVGRWDRVVIADLTPHVNQGSNLLEMTVVNANAPPPESPDDNPTGLSYRIDVEY